MKTLLLLLAAWWIASSVGSVVLVRLRVNTVITPLERSVFSSALGLGFAAYGVFALGLLGLLSFWPVTLLWVLLAGLGWSGMKANSQELFGLVQLIRGTFKTSQAVTLKQSAFIVTICAILFCGFVALIACYQPPDAHAWDALAYHLADPKLFLRHHSIYLLPTEHHSNFPFTMEMLFTVGLLYDGYALANLFHFLMAVLIVLGINAFCRRWLSPTAGLIAALLFMTTPLVLWEASVAYIDLGLSLYIFLSVYVAAILLETRRDRLKELLLRSSGACILCGVLMGFALGIKYLALLPLTFLALLLLLRRLPLRSVVLYALTALAIGSPWYIKNSLWMHNPVYPFAYSIFPHSRFWSADRAAPYAEEQRGFGSDHTLSKPVQSFQNLVLTPWRLISSPSLYTNKADFTFTSLIGGLYIGLLFSLAYLRRLSSVIHDLLFLSGLMFMSWFFVSQHIRYLIPLLPFLAIVCGYAADRWITSRPAGRTKIVNGTLSSIVCSALVGQFLLLAWGVCALPVFGKAAEETFQYGLEPTALSLPEALAEVTQPDEHVKHLNRLNSYGAVEWINRNTAYQDGVVLYEDVHGFYLDRDFIWGNGEHSSYIPYGKFHDGQDLSHWLSQKGFRYALFNLNPSFYPFNKTMLLPDDPAVVEKIMRQWYTDRNNGAIKGSWRYIVGDAINRGIWTVKYTHHGVAVLEIGAR